MTFAVISGLIAVNVASVSQAQTSEACTEAQVRFVSIMKSFRSAYFEREEASASAESLLIEQVVPNAEKVYQVCPKNINTVIEQLVKKSSTDLNDPNRAQLVECDKSLITYQRSLNKFDNSNRSAGYNAYRNALNKDIRPAAQGAINACPQMSELTQQTRVEIAERQKRLDQMEDLDNAGPSIADNIETSTTNNTEYYDSLEE